MFPGDGKTTRGDSMRYEGCQECDKSTCLPNNTIQESVCFAHRVHLSPMPCTLLCTNVFFSRQDIISNEW